MILIAQKISAARRTALIKARGERRIGDEVMREELEKMDLEQTVMANWSADNRWNSGAALAVGFSIPGTYESRWAPCVPAHGPSQGQLP